MPTKTKAIIAGAFFSILILIGGVVAVLIAMRQNTTNPVAPTVPQSTPQASEPTTTPACSVSFSVATPSGVVCDALTANPGTSGTAPFTTTFTLTGHGTNGATVVAYKFDFGDGTTPASQAANTLSHTFSTEKKYIVKGTVVDNLGRTAGGSGSCQLEINVNRVVYKYKKCENNACKEADCVPNSTPCSGLTSCSADTDCQPKYQHKVCLGNACSVVDCSPVTTRCADSCTSNANCVPVVYITPTPAPPQGTHYECRNKACVVVAGAGTNTCTSDATCQPVAKPPVTPTSGNTALTISILLLGIGAVVAGALILL